MTTDPESYQARTRVLQIDLKSYQAIHSVLIEDPNWPAHTSPYINNNSNESAVDFRHWFQWISSLQPKPIHLDKNLCQCQRVPPAKRIPSESSEHIMVRTLESTTYPRMAVSNVGCRLLQTLKPSARFPWGDRCAQPQPSRLFGPPTGPASAKDSLIHISWGAAPPDTYSSWYGGLGD